MLNITHSPYISVLLPTHKRTETLDRSVRSLVDLCSDPTRLEILFGIDDNDETTKQYFLANVVPYLNEKSVRYIALEFKPMGYEGLNLYYNALAARGQGHWLFVWNDDAVMQTKNWDLEVEKYHGEFLLLRLKTHRSHPYSIFPIFPKEWHDLFGLCSRHQMVDAELSQNAYYLDIMQNIDVEAIHDRFDLTGNNKDNGQTNKRMFEGNPSDPRDFHNPEVVRQRLQDVETLFQYMKKKGIDNDFWELVKTGKASPWTKLKANDPNNLTVVREIK